MRGESAPSKWKGGAEGGGGVRQERGKGTGRIWDGMR